MKIKSMIATPVEPVANPPSGNKGGSGTYDGEKGYPARTKSKAGVPEKVRDGK